MLHIEERHLLSFLKVIDSILFFVCVSVMYSGECDVCGVTLNVHPDQSG
jgi:hypothetical protein